VRRSRFRAGAPANHIFAPHPKGRSKALLGPPLLIPHQAQLHACRGPATGGKDLLLLTVTLFGKREVVPVVAGSRSACRNLELRPDSRPFANDLGLWTLGRLTRLICFDRHNRFDHHDFRVMAAGTSTVWAFYVQVAVPMRLPDAGRLDGSNPPGSRLLAKLRLAVV
jgi:hypothetical protein